jgi:hypothetical protein
VVLLLLLLLLLLATMLVLVRNLVLLGPAVLLLLLLSTATVLLVLVLLVLVVVRLDVLLKRKQLRRDLVACHDCGPCRHRSLYICSCCHCYRRLYRMCSLHCLHRLHCRLAPWQRHHAQDRPHIVRVCHLLHASDLMGRRHLLPGA